MKYIEELSPGSIFEYQNHKYVLSADFKQQKQIPKKMCVSIHNGHIHWLGDNEIVEQVELYYRDNDRNILPLN